MRKTDKEKHKTYVYLAHPYNTIGTKGEADIIEELKLRGLTVYNPFEEEGNILKKYGKDSYYEGPIFWQLARDIWTKDIGAVKTCDILVAWIPNKEAIGTSAEIATAYEYNVRGWTERIFIQIISPYKHPSFSVYADQLFESIEEWKKMRVYKWDMYEGE